jgi:putative transposase
MGMKTYKYRLYPSKTQEVNLVRVLDACRGLYNMALAERKYGWRFERRSVSKSELEQLAKRYRETFLYAQQMYSQTAQSVVTRVDNAFKRFFEGIKNGKKGGYPRFKSSNRYNSFEFKQYGSGAILDGRRLKLFGIGRIPVRWHRAMDGEIKVVRLLRRAGKWFALFVCQVPDLPELPKTGRVIGIDVGVESLLTTSDGEKVENPNYYRNSQRQLRVLQRSVVRKQRGSRSRKEAVLQLQRQHEHIANQRRDYAHKVSTRLVQHCDAIAIEDLQITNMVKNKHLSKSILDAGWGLFKQLLTNKAIDASRELELVNSAYTSKSCSACGYIFEDLTLSHRWVTCECGLSLDRDHNAAINILKKAGWDAPVYRNVTPLFDDFKPSDKRKRGTEATRIYP